MAGGCSLGGLASSTKQEDLVARSTAKNPNIAGRTEGDGDLELLLVKDKENLITKVGRVSTPLVMYLLAVVLG